MFSIERRVDVSATERRAIEALASDCDGVDGTRTEIDCDKSLNFHKDLPSFYWTMDTDLGMLGLISIFAPDADTAEIEAMVHPSFRRRGLFAALLAAAEGEYRAAGYRDILLLRDAASVPGGEAMTAWGAKRGTILEHREFSMLLPPEAIAAPKAGREVRYPEATIGPGLRG